MKKKIKEEILRLPQDRRNFVRSPPTGVDFNFDYDVSYPVALAIMTEDPALEKMRFELVPKIITEENFWRNYFYRVSLIIQAGDLGTLGSDGNIMGQASSEEVKTSQSETNTIATVRRFAGNPKKQVTNEEPSAGSGKIIENKEKSQGKSSR